MPQRIKKEKQSKVFFFSKANLNFALFIVNSRRTNYLFYINIHV